MSRITIRRVSNVTGKVDEVEVEGHRFSHYVDGYSFWFAIHQAIDADGFVVTHIDSGMRVKPIDNDTIVKCKYDVKAAARMVIDMLVERLGAEKVRDRLENPKPKNS